LTLGKLALKAMKWKSIGIRLSIIVFLMKFRYSSSMSNETFADYICTCVAL